MIKPMSKCGQDKLINDCDILEETVRPVHELVNLWDLRITETKMNELQAFKGLVQSKTEDIPELIKHGLVKTSVVLHLLFSRAPPEMKLPHESVNWSISRYSTWFE